MPLPFLPANAAAPVSHLSVTRFSLAKAVGSMELVNVHNDGDRHFPCHVANVRGHFHKDAIGAAEVCARSVLMEAATAPAGKNKAELEKCVGWMDGGRQGSLGTVLHTRFVALGTLYAALLHMQKEHSGNQDVNACMKRVKDATTNLGAMIGKCSTPPDGTMGPGPAKDVNLASLAARDCIAECMAALDRDAVFSAISATVLVEPMIEALQRRQPGVLQQIRNGGDVSKLLPEVLLKGETDATAEDIEYLLSASSKDDPQAALIAALKLPDFVAEGDPGRGGAKPNKEKGVSDLPPGVRELAGDGKNVAVNYNDFGKMGNKSTVDGANAAQLAALDVEKHRITIDGMLKAFKLGLEGSRGCGHLITGIHNPSGNVSTFTHDPRQAKNTGSIEIQTDPIEDGPQRENIVNREIHQGSGNVLDGDDQLLGTPQSHQDNAIADPDASTYTIAEKDPIVWGDESLGNTYTADRAIRVDSSDDNVRSPDSADSHVEQSVVGDGGDRWVDLLEKRLQALKSNNSDLENVPERIENEGIDETTPERVSQFDNVPEIFRIKASYVRSAPPESIRDESVGRDRVPRMDFVQDDNDVAKQGFTARVRFFEDAARRAGESGTGVTGTLGFVPPPTVNPKGSVISPEREFKLYVDARNEENSDRLMLDAGSEDKVEDFSRWRGKSMGAGDAAGSILVQDMKAFFRNRSLDKSVTLIQPSITRGLGLAYAATVVAGGSTPKPIPGRQGSQADGARTISSSQKFMSLRKEGASVSDALSKSGAGKAVGGMAQAKSQAARIERLMQTEMPASVNPAVISQEELSRSPLRLPEIDSLPDQALADTSVDLQARLDGQRLSSPTLDRQSSSVEQDQASSPKGPIGAMTANLLSDFRNVKLKPVPKIWRDSLGQGWRDMKGLQ